MVSDWTQYVRLGPYIQKFHKMTYVLPDQIHIDKHVAIVLLSDILTISV